MEKQREGENIPIDEMDTSLQSCVEFAFTTTTCENLSFDNKVVGAFEEGYQMMVRTPAKLAQYVEVGEVIPKLEATVYASSGV